MSTPQSQAMAEVNVSARLTPYSGRILVEGDLLRTGDRLVVLANAHHKKRGTATSVGEVMST